MYYRNTIEQNRKNKIIHDSRFDTNAFFFAMHISSASASFAKAQDK
jgi:hypothetical protein